jgi:hypothetical protein
MQNEQNRQTEPIANLSLIPVTISQSWSHSARICEIVVTSDETGKDLPNVTRIELHPDTKTARIFVARHRTDGARPAGTLWPGYRAEIVEEGGQP